MLFFVNLANAAAAHLLCETAYKTGYESGYNQALLDVYTEAEKRERAKQGSIISPLGQLILPGSKDW